jgi:site-specific recombinase XerD
MASLLGRNGTQYANFYDSNRKPKQKRFSLKTQSKKVARRLLADLEDAYAAGRWDPWLDSLEDFHDRPTQALTLAEAQALYVEAKREADLSEHTLRDYRSTLRGLTDAVGAGQALERLKAAQIARYTQSDEVARSTRRKRHDTVKAFLNWLRARDYLEAEPMKLMQPPKKKEGLPRALRPAMLEKMLEALSESGSTKDTSWHGQVWRFACASGLRVRELARLRWKHVDRERGVIELNEQKSGNAGTAPLTDQAARVLDEVGEGRPAEYVFRSSEGHATERSANA